MLRGAAALNLLRDSHQLAAMHILKTPRTGRTSCARYRHNKYQPDQPQHRRRSGASASHISGEAKPDPSQACQLRYQKRKKVRCPVSWPRMTHKYIWIGSLALTLRQTLESSYRVSTDLFYMRPSLRYIFTKQERQWMTCGERRIRTESRISHNLSM